MLDVSDHVAEQLKLGIAWTLWQDDEPCVQFCVGAEPNEVGVIVGDERELFSHSKS